MNTMVRRKFLGSAINSTPAVKSAISAHRFHKNDSKQESAPDGYWEDIETGHDRLLPDIYLHTIHNNLVIPLPNF
jgi:hypothetical protein